MKNHLRAKAAQQRMQELINFEPTGGQLPEILEKTFTEIREKFLDAVMEDWRDDVKSTTPLFISNLNRNVSNRLDEIMRSEASVMEKFSATRALLEYFNHQLSEYEKIADDDSMLGYNIQFNPNWNGNPGGTPVIDKRVKELDKLDLNRNWPELEKELSKYIN